MKSRASLQLADNSWSNQAWLAISQILPASYKIALLNMRDMVIPIIRLKHNPLDEQATG